MSKMVVFDLDGTLLNTLDNIAGHMNKTLEDFSLAPFPISQYRYFVGNGAVNLTHRALGAHGKDTPEFFEPFFASFIRAYEGAPDEGVTVYDGIFELLSSLHEAGVQTAVCTNKPHAAALRSVEHFFPSNTFCEVLGAREGVPLKPAPDAVLGTLEKYGVSREDALFVGDSDVDMLTATAAGIRGFGALWGFRTEKELREAGATGVLSHPLELLSFL